MPIPIIEELSKQYNIVDYIEGYYDYELNKKI